MAGVIPVVQAMTVPEGKFPAPLLWISKVKVPLFPAPYPPSSFHWRVMSLMVPLFGAMNMTPNFSCSVAQPGKIRAAASLIV